ncbi:MAG: VOC family protein [Polyangiaceae bacterium]|nr:VOC family protein [Polyangiaceae bacterium]
MTPRISVITLGVTDLVRSRRFYIDGLGWKASSTSDEHVVFIDLGGIVLGLYPRDLLAKDATLVPGTGFGGVTLAQNMKSKAEVDAALRDAVEAGATLLKPAADTFWGGYSGYFADPDGHPWEVAFNPFWGLDEAGRVLLPG